MGCFSWNSCVSGKSIGYECSAVLLLPDDTIIKGAYNGYGEIDGVDVYILHALGWDVKAARTMTASVTPQTMTNSEAQSLRCSSIDVDCLNNESQGGG